jgi:hypothetical protein
MYWYRQQEPVMTSNIPPESVRYAAQSVNTIIEIVKKWRAYRISDMATLKMLYLELDRLLELIELFENKGFLEKAVAGGGIFPLLKEIDLSVTGLVLAREEKHNVFKKIMKRGILSRKKKAATLRDYENALQALSFIYSKTGILKHLAESHDKILLREIKLAERLRNIEQSVNPVLQVLVTFPRVNVIARRWHRQQ